MRVEGYKLSKDDQIAIMLQAKVGGALPVVVEDNKDGSYIATFVPSQVGDIKLSTSIGGKHIQGSPFTYPAVSIANKVINDDGRYIHTNICTYTYR